MKRKIWQNQWAPTDVYGSYIIYIYIYTTDYQQMWTPYVFINWLQIRILSLVSFILFFSSQKYLKETKKYNRLLLRIVSIAAIVQWQWEITKGISKRQKQKTTKKEWRRWAKKKKKSKGKSFHTNIKRKRKEEGKRRVFFFGRGKKKKKDYKQTKMFPPSTGEVCHKKNRATERNKRLAQITLFLDKTTRSPRRRALYVYVCSSSVQFPILSSLLLRLEISNFLSVVFLQTPHFDQSGYAR